MAAEGATPARSSTVGPQPPGRAGVSTSPVAVVWCRQVDNEAESPGYTTVPEEFPGHRETLETIRTVGNLTINVADTHDYWDPDPAQPLSYYPNLFLYPAYGGRYTCLGRMFLSTEDRPRLGMKTLVLDTAQLLASGDFGATILRWHASMGGPRREGSRPAPVPDGGLYPVVGEGFLFHRGSTDPVVIVASDDWETTMEAILDLVRLLPASLVALGAILAFPYFLPQPKTNLHEFTEQVPLSLALMRVPRSEAAGERHAKRMASWESAPVTLRDLTAGVPAAPKGKENVPLVLQYARDRLDSKLLPISQRVDLVEASRVKGHLADPERQGGQDHRKEMWRIGTAMESAALLLQRARGRHVPVNVETAKRAQEYLQARLPESDRSSGFPTAAESAVVAPVAATAAVETGAVPPWLQKAPEPPPPPRPAAPEVVPVSISDDPSLLPPAPKPMPTPAPKAAPPPKPASPPATAPPSAPPSTSAALPPPPPPPTTANRSVTVAPAGSPEPARPPIDAVALRGLLQQDLLKLLEQRLATMPRPTGGAGPATALDDRLRTDLDARTDARIAAAVQQISNQVGAALKSLEERQGRAADERFSGQEARLKEATSVGITAELDRRFQAIVEPRLNDLGRQVRESIDKSSTSVRDENRADLNRAVEALKVRVDQTEQSMRESLSTQLDLHLREAADREKQSQAALQAKLDTAIQRYLTDIETKRVREGKDVEERLGQLVDARLRDSHEKVTGLALTQEAKVGAVVDQRIAGLEERMSQALDGRLTEAQEERVHALADLQVRLQSFFEQKLREESERERQKYLELLARLKGEVESSLARMVDSSRFDSSLREKIARALEAFRAESQRTLDSRLATAEQQLKVEQTDLTERFARLDQSVEERRSEIKLLEEASRSEIDDLDRRTQILSDRLVPVVRKTWLRVAELQQGGGSSAESEVQLNQLRRELNREIHRLDTELLERSTEIRDRMEAAISNQGRVWLTLIRQLSQLTGDRRLEIDRSPGATMTPADVDRLEAIPAAYADMVGTDLEEDPVNPLDPDPSAPLTRPASADRGRDDAAARKRFRRAPR